MSGGAQRLPLDQVDFRDADAGHEAAREASVAALDVQAQAPATT